MISNRSYCFVSLKIDDSIASPRLTYKRYNNSDPKTGGTPGKK
jgi:hypothetical protein